MTGSELVEETRRTLVALGTAAPEGDLAVRTPIDGQVIATVPRGRPADVEPAVARAATAFATWREVPAPVRGQVVRAFADELRAHRDHLGRLVTLETGKITAEGRGEVQEMIDICDFAVGLSRQLYGRTIASERPGHRMMETWHPLGPCAVITAFNFPVAVWAWNAALALVCGDPVIWKPSERTPLTALACRALFERAAASVGGVPGDLVQIVTGGAEVAGALADHPGLPLVSATGSTAMGRALAPRIAARFGRALLELGGNNAMVVTASADLDLAVRAIVFAAVGTAGQRCTSLRRLIVDRRVHDEVVDRVAKAYATLPIGDPLDDATLVGPLIDADAGQRMQLALERAADDGGRVVAGGSRVLADRYPDAYYVEPAVVVMPEQTELMREETFAPLLYALAYEDLDEAITIHNDVPQGLASAIFTTDVREAERFASATGSDCGIVNVNIGPSGAEIGGAFGGEKDTGGGREAGSDAWKTYMRRATTTVNWSDSLPLAQGVQFG